MYISTILKDSIGLVLLKRLNKCMHKREREIRTYKNKDSCLAS